MLTRDTVIRHLVTDPAVVVSLDSDQGAQDYFVPSSVTPEDAAGQARRMHADEQDRTDWPTLTGGYTLSREGVALYTGTAA